MRARLGEKWGRLGPIGVDAVVASVLLAISLVDIWGASSARGPVTASVVSVAIAIGVAVRRRWLLWALVGVAGAVAARAVVHGVHGVGAPTGIEGSLMALLLFYGAGAYLGGARSIVALMIGIAITSIIAIGANDGVAPNLIWDDIAIAALPWFVGRMMRERNARAMAARARAERLDSEHEMHMRVAALSERARLAREIHDVVAHSVSVMVIQAGGARSVMDGEPARAEQALLSVERAGREALAEMRRLLGVLGEGERLRELAPQPGIEDLEDLIARTCTAGVEASINVSGRPVAVPPGLSLCAYRVVQEALTNTIKHAGAARAEVSVRWHGDALELEVADDGPGRAAQIKLDSGGHGIIGMRERAALHGGKVETGPIPGGGFAVRALIPLEGLAGS